MDLSAWFHFLVVLLSLSSSLKADSKYHHFYSSPPELSFYWNSVRTKETFTHSMVRIFSFPKSLRQRTPILLQQHRLCLRQSFVQLIWYTGLKKGDINVLSNFSFSSLQTNSFFLHVHHPTSFPFCISNWLLTYSIYPNQKRKSYQSPLFIFRQQNNRIRRTTYVQQKSKSSRGTAAEKKVKAYPFWLV